MTITFFIVGALLFITVATLVSSDRFGDVFYLATTHAKVSLFLVLCLSVGALAGINFREGGSYAPAVSLPALSLPVIGDLYQPSEEKTLATIRNCQAFVTAQLEHRTLPERADSSSSLLHLASDVLPSTSTDWDRCARAFGMNYWKEDISVKGEKNGGHALCRAYRAQNEYQSGEVNAWCETVFKPQP